MREQGSRRPHAAIRAHWRLQLLHVRNAHRRARAHPVLAVAAPVPGHAPQVYQLARAAQRPDARAAREWDQLHELLHRWVYLPCVFVLRVWLRLR